MTRRKKKGAKSDAQEGVLTTASNSDATSDTEVPSGSSIKYLKTTHGVADGEMTSFPVYADGSRCPFVFSFKPAEGAKTIDTLDSTSAADTRGDLFPDQENTMEVQHMSDNDSGDDSDSESSSLDEFVFDFIEYFKSSSSKVCALMTQLSDFYGIDYKFDKLYVRYYMNSVKLSNKRNIDFFIRIDNELARACKCYSEDIATLEEISVFLAGLHADVVKIVDTIKLDERGIPCDIDCKSDDLILLTIDYKKTRPYFRNTDSVEFRNRLNYFYRIRDKLASHNNKTKSDTPTHIEISNPFQALENIENAGEGSNEIVNSNSVNEIKMPGGRTPISVLVTKELDIMKLFEAINAQLRSPVYGRLVGGFVRFLPKNDTDYDQAISVLQQRNVQYFTVSPKHLRPLKVVIRGLPTHTDVKSLHQELNRLGFECNKVYQFKSKDKKLIPVFCAVFNYTCLLSEIFKVQYIFHLKVSIQKFRASRPQQCYRCQGFFHSSECCRLPPVCLKCAGDHLTKECKLKPEEKATCANCKGNHPANYGGCPAFPMYKQERRSTYKRSQTNSVFQSPIKQSTENPGDVNTGMSDKNLSDRITYANAVDNRPKPRRVGLRHGNRPVTDRGERGTLRNSRISETPADGNADEFSLSLILNFLKKLREIINSGEDSLQKIIEVVTLACSILK